jgi:cysteine desulfurase/selenocysteine lyase
VTTPLPRSEFAVTDRFIYFNHAAVGVLPVSTRDAIDAFVHAHAEAGVMGTYTYEAKMPAYRERIGRFVGASGGEIAILRNTGDGANAIAQGIDWQPGDELILPDNEFPSNAIPWLALRDRGVHVKFISSERERMTPDVLRREISKRTRVVTVSWVGFADGYRYDLPALAEVAHEAGAAFCVDAIQGLGAFPLDVDACGIDALYAGGAKWLMSLQGVSFLYVRKALLERLRLAAPGWRSTADMWDFLNYDQPLSDDASRFEGGTPNFVGAVSLDRSIELLARAGTDKIGEHVLALTDRLSEGLLRSGAELLTVRGDGISSGIVTFRVPGCDSVTLGRALQAKGVITTWRPNGIRVAPHGYNTTDEIDRMLELVPQCIRSIAS